MWTYDNNYKENMLNTSLIIIFWKKFKFISRKHSLINVRDRMFQLTI